MVSEKDVSYVADLAHLELTAEERARMLKDLNSILGYIERLNQLDTAECGADGAGGEPLRRWCGTCHARGRIEAFVAAR